MNTRQLRKQKLRSDDTLMWNQTEAGFNLSEINLNGESEPISKSNTP